MFLNIFLNQVCFFIYTMKLPFFNRDNNLLDMGDGFPYIKKINRHGQGDGISPLATIKNEIPMIVTPWWEFHLKFSGET